MKLKFIYSQDSFENRIKVCEKKKKRIKVSDGKESKGLMVADIHLKRKENGIDQQREMRTSQEEEETDAKEGFN